ncbi:MAG: hypothetical protein KIS66_14900 [Fimbriimonadaceae bacterium]|nr:hypothetical protein [Fimbriimonadaceae bacterium]
MRFENDPEMERQSTPREEQASLRQAQGVATEASVAAGRVLLHRAYRRLFAQNRWVLLITVLVAAVVHYFFFLNVEWFVWKMCVYAQQAGAFLDFGARGGSLGYDDYMWRRLYPLVFDIPEFDRLGYLIRFLICGVIALLLALWRGLNAPIRLFLVTTVLICTVSTLYLAIVQDLGFDGFEISKLYLRLVLLTWVCLPIPFLLLSLGFPFNPIERLLVTFLPVVYDFGFSIVRYLVLIWLASTLGGWAVPLFFVIVGPLMMVVFYICFFSLAMKRVADRMRRDEVKGKVWRL